MPELIGRLCFLPETDLNCSVCPCGYLAVLRAPDLQRDHVIKPRTEPVVDARLLGDPARRLHDFGRFLIESSLITLRLDGIQAPNCSLAHRFR